MSDRKIHFFTCRTKKGSDRCRGMDIAEKMDMPCDEFCERIETDDVVVMVKRFDSAMLKRSNHVYVDIVDGCRGDTYEKIRQHEGVTIITLTPMGAEWVKKNWFPGHRVIWIPHTHCNDENQLRTERPVDTILYNGTLTGFAPHFWNEFEPLATREGFNVIRKHTITPLIPKIFRSQKQSLREICCDVYMGCDIQVAFRPHFEDKELPLHLKSPTKLNNAGSFRIPSVAYPEVAFTHNYGKGGHFVKVATVERMVQCCIELRDSPDTYSKIAFSAWIDAQPYHISKVIKYYERLLQ